MARSAGQKVQRETYLDQHQGTAVKEPRLMAIYGKDTWGCCSQTTSHGQRGFIEGSMQSTMGIGEASAAKDKIVKDAAEEAAQAEGIVCT